MLKTGGFTLDDLFRVRVQGFKVELPDWKTCNLADAACRDLANVHLSPEVEAKAISTVMASQWPTKAIRNVGAARIFVVAQRAMRRPRTKDLARKWRDWLHRIAFAPPELSAEAHISGGTS